MMTPMDEDATGKRTGGVCFVDCETTGLDPDQHEIWEVGLILPDGSEHEWQLPVDLSRADPMALNVGRFHERRWLPVPSVKEKSQTSLRSFAYTFARQTRGLHMAGAVVSFDAERLWKLLRANGECPMWHYHLIDVEALAAGHIAGTRRTVAAVNALAGEAFWAGTSEWVVAEGPDAAPPWDSNVLSLAVGVDPKQFSRHTALGDARWAKAIYEAVMSA